MKSLRNARILSRLMIVRRIFIKSWLASFSWDRIWVIWTGLWARRRGYRWKEV